MTVIINYTTAGVQKAEIFENVKGVVANDDGILIVNGFNNHRFSKGSITSFAII